MSNTTEDPLNVYTDGACLGNPGPGGWGFVRMGEIWGSGFEAETTNNQMEMQAVVEALRATEGPVRICTDSEYLVKGWNQWIEGWLKRGWKTASGRHVKNRERWEELISVAEGRKVDIVWVKAHSGIAGNETADRLAHEAAETGEGGTGDGDPFPGWDPETAERRHTRYVPGAGPATDKQKRFAVSLAEKVGCEIDIGKLNGMSKSQISALIEDLKNRTKRPL